MKLNKVLVIVLFGFIFLFAAKSSAEALDPYRHLCVGIQGKFTANSTWKGGNIQVGCQGDDGGATSDPSQKCTGQIITNVEPGETFRLTKCSCWGTDKGCLKMGKELRLEPLNSANHRIITIVKNIKDTPAFINGQCRHTDLRPICGSNGQHKTGNIKITCEVPNTPTKTPTPTKAPSKTPTPTRNPSLTPTPTPAFCPVPDKVQNVKVTCPNCFGTTQPDTQIGDINWEINGLFLSANNPYVQVGETKIEIKNNPTLSESSAEIYKVGNEYKAQLSGTWVTFSGIINDETSMLMSFSFSYTPGSFWKVTEISVSDGSRDDVFIKYGPKTKTGDTIQNEVGDYYIDNGSATEFVSVDGENTLHFENLQIGAFINGVGN